MSTQDIGTALGIQNPTNDQEEQLKVIAEYTDGDTSKVRELERKLGSTSLGETRLTKLYRYVKLRSVIG